MTRAAGLGFNVLRPHGDSMPFDVVLECNGRFIRIQVKSVSRRRPKLAGYLVNVAHSGRTHAQYSRREVDFIAALIIPENIWYIIPVEKVGSKTRLWIGTKALVWAAFEDYREAWHLLGRPRRKRTRWGRARTKK